MSMFAGKVALVTGGGSGIGRAAALAFAREGAQVVVAGRRVPDGEETVRLINAQNGEAIFVRTDVTRDEEVRALVETTIATFGRLDYAFNNAGNEGRPGLLIEQDEDTFDYTVDTNLKGVWLAMKYEIPRMIERGGGVIVNNASNLGHTGMANMALYTATKHAVVGLTKASALEYARQGVRVNAVSPGPIETPMPERAFGDLASFREFMEPLVPQGRVGKPEEVAEAVIWLCSNSSAFVTGHSLLIDGGLIAQ